MLLDDHPPAKRPLYNSHDGTPLPGTGKTTTALLLVRAWVFTNQRPILCAADSNIAVDNLVDGCAKAKLSVVRVGRPEATRTDLEQYNVLDMVKDADPDRRECDASKTQVLTRVGSYSANFARIAGFSLTLFGGRFWKTCPPMSLDVTGPCLGHPTKPGGLVYRRAF